MDLSWLWKKKKEKEKTVKIDDLFDYSKKKTEELIQLYRSEKYLLERLANRNMGWPLEDDFYKEARKMENEIIIRIPDEFERNVLRAIAGLNFDLTEYMDKKWDKEIREACLRVCHYLKFGNRYPDVSSAFNPLPFPGHEFFGWILSNTSDDRNDRFSQVGKRASEEFRQNRIMGKEYPEERIKSENLPPLMDSVGNRIIMLMSPEFAREVRIIVEIWQMKDERGKEYIKNILKDMP